MWLADILTECAWAAAHTRRSYLGAQFWRLARRIGKKKAAIAVGHSILVIAWHLLTEDSDYEDLGSDYFTRRDAVPSPQPGHQPTRGHGLPRHARARRLIAAPHSPFSPHIPGGTPVPA